MSTEPPEQSGPPQPGGTPPDMDATIVPPPAGPLDGPPTVPLNEQKPPAVPEQPPVKKSSNTWLIVGGVVIVLCCLLTLCGAAAVFISSSSSKGSSPIPSFGASDTPYPTPVIESTVEPEDTLTPEETLEPTTEVIPTSATQLTVKAYGTTVATPLKAFSKALTDLGGLMKQVSSEPGLLLDDTWRASVRSKAAIVKAKHAEIAALNPPDELADMHGTLIDGTGDCSEAMDHLTTGIDTLDADEVSKAVDLINSCSDKVDQAQAKLDDYLKNH